MVRMEREVIPSRREIEGKLMKVGDYVKIDYLSSCLKMHLDFDTKKFVLTQLSSLYENKKMFLEAARLTRNSAEINTTVGAKITDFIKSAELFIKAGNFDEADVSFNKAIALASTEQKAKYKQMYKNHYKTHAMNCLKAEKRRHALKAYEKVLSLEPDANEKKDAKEKLLQLYEQLGKIHDFYALQKSV